MSASEPSIGTQIRKLRGDRGLSLSGLAEEAKVSKSYLWNLEKDEGRSRPSGQTLYRIAQALGTTMSELMGHELLVDEPPDTSIPESLRAFAERAGLSHRDVKMLAGVNFRGQRPEDEDSWALIWQAIKHGVRSSH